MWQILIEGWEPDLKYLEKHFASGSDRIKRDSQTGNYIFDSESLHEANTYEQVLQRTREQLAVLSGILITFRNSPHPLNIKEIYRLNSHGGKEFFLEVHEAIHAFDSTECTLSTSGSEKKASLEPSPPSPVLLTAQLALREPSVAKAMRLLAADDRKSWVNMYRILEVVTADVGGERKLPAFGWCSAKDLDRFKHSSNSVAVAGDSARHGKESCSPPSDPMSLEQASDFLHKVLQAWLRHKGV